MAAKVQPLPDEEVEAMLAVASEWEKELLLLRQEHGVAIAGQMKGLCTRAAYQRLKSLRERAHAARSPATPVASPVRSANLTFEELVADRKRTYERLKNHEDDKAALTITLPEAAPYGIFLFGDPHVDDDGCDWPALHRHIDLIRNTPGLYAANLGDLTNNWVGRLERLYASQRTTAAEAHILAEGFIKSLMGKWLFHIGGNHDLWAGANDPLPGLCSAAAATYIPIGGTVAVRAGSHSFFINARHTFPGNSMWNTAHGPARSVLLGNDAHLTVCGHKHTTGHNVLVSAKGRICHALQVASYKMIDDYALAGGFRNNTVSPAALVVVDPRFPDTDPAMQTVFHSVERGAAYLNLVRGEYEQAQKARRKA